MVVRESGSRKPCNSDFTSPHPPGGKQRSAAMMPAHGKTRRSARTITTLSV